MTESQWRFLNAIAARVPTDRIVELRLFPVIRQGGMESGAAVVAVEEIVDLPLGEVAPDGAVPASGSPGSEVAAGDTGPTDAEIEVDLGPLFAPVADVSTEAAGSTLEEGDRGERDVPSQRASTGASGDQVALSTDDTPVASDDETPLPQSSASQSGSTTPPPDSPVDIEVSPESLYPAEEHSTRQQVKRYSVLAARYRLTLKGPERGAWDFELTHEADAPLDTVERVARGVARRSGDEGQPEHLTASDIRATLAQPWWSGAQ